MTRTLLSVILFVICISEANAQETETGWPSILTITTWNAPKSTTLKKYRNEGNSDRPKKPEADSPSSPAEIVCWSDPNKIGVELSPQLPSVDLYIGTPERVIWQTRLTRRIPYSSLPQSMKGDCPIYIITCWGDEYTGDITLR